MKNGENCSKEHDILRVYKIIETSKAFMNSLLAQNQLEICRDYVSQKAQSNRVLKTIFFNCHFHIRHFLML